MVKLADKEKIKIAKAFIRKAKKVIKIDSAYLFGSTVKGNSDKYSDIDIAIISSEFTGNTFADLRKLNSLIIETDPRIEVHTYPKHRFGKTMFSNYIKKTGIKLI